MKKVILSCAVAAAVGLSFNVSAHDVANTGDANSPTKSSGGSTFTTTVKADAKKVYTGAKEYGHKAYDATKSVFSGSSQQLYCCQA